MNIHSVCEDTYQGLVLHCETPVDRIVMSKILEEKRLPFRTFVSEEFLFLNYDSSDAFNFYSWYTNTKAALQRAYDKYFEPYTAADLYKKYRERNLKI